MGIIANSHTCPSLDSKPTKPASINQGRAAMAPTSQAGRSLISIGLDTFQNDFNDALQVRIV